MKQQLTFSFVLLFALLINSIKCANTDYPHLSLVSSFLDNAETQNDVETAEPYIADDDSDFTIVTDINGGFISETEYARGINELQAFLNTIPHVDRDVALKFDAIQTLSNWYDGEKFTDFAFWSGHIYVMEYILNTRACPGVYIPDSIVKYYINYLVDKIIIPRRANQQFSNDLISLIVWLIKAEVQPEVLTMLLQAIHKDFNDSQIKTLFYSLNSVFDEFYKKLYTMDLSEQAKRLYLIIRLYLTILKFFKLKLNGENAIKFQNIPAIFLMFCKVVPLFQTFLLDRTFEYLYDKLVVDSDYMYRAQYLKMIDIFLKESDFNNNFVFNSSKFAHKKELFAKLRYSLFQRTDLQVIIDYLVTNKFMFLFNGFLIYSEKDESFTNSVINIFELFLTRKIAIGILSALLAVCPEINISTLESVATRHSTSYLDFADVKELKCIIMATEHVYYSETNVHVWNMPPALKCFIDSVELDQSLSRKLEPRKYYFFHAARIFLFRQYNIPFTSTTFGSVLEEDVDWREMIGFVNFFLERESVKHCLSEVPQELYEPLICFDCPSHAQSIPNT